MGAAMDVFDTEPLPADHPLLQLDNVTVTPHLAGSTIDAFRNSPALMAQHLIRLLTSEERLPIVNGVNPARRPVQRLTHPSRTEEICHEESSDRTPQVHPRARCAGRIGRRI